MEKENQIIKTEAVEAEILDENGVPLDGAGNRQTPKAPRAFTAVLGAVSVLVFTFLFSLLMALLAVLVFIPMLILKMLGLVKSEVKIFKL